MPEVTKTYTEKILAKSQTCTCLC